MKKSRKIIFLIIGVLIVIGLVWRSGLKSDQEETPTDLQSQNTINQDNTDQEQEADVVEEQQEIEIPIQTEENETTQPKEEIDALKQNTGKTGDTELYEVQDGYNNTKIVTIKSSVKYKVAFAGMSKDQAPSMDELDNILEQKHPKYAGIWIYEKDRDNLLKMLKAVTNSEYKIDENGYLKILNKNNQNENDKKLESIIKGEKLYIIRNSSTCYIVDEVTGEILDYNFESMDRYQTYEYFEDGDKMLVFVTENNKNQMTTKEIIQSVIDLIN